MRFPLKPMPEQDFRKGAGDIWTRVLLKKIQASFGWRADQSLLGREKAS
jgi:hypothetical protein